MEYYLPIKHAHILLALLSGLGFALRGFVRLVLNRTLEHRLLKVAPHVIDTLLLASGVTLWVNVGWPLLSWLGLKLMLVVAYIVLGMMAFRSMQQTRAVWLYLAALAVFLSIAALALHKPL
jgi:uncharacterized membrane protein SirB2